MKIIAPGIAPDTGNAPARADAVYAQQWRKVLEEAQWQARQRIAPMRPGEAGPRPAASAVTDATTLPAAPELPGATVARAVPAAAAARVEALSTAIAGAVRTAPAPQAAQNALPPAGLPAGAGDAFATPGRVAAAAPLAAALRWHELPEWPAVMVHASVQGRSISVGIRDRAVQEDDALELLYRLRAQLRAAGLELTSLTVNGHNVTAAQDAPSHAG